MKITSTILFLLFATVSSVQARDFQELSSFDFSPSSQSLQNGDIQYFYTLSPDSNTLNALKELDINHTLSGADSSQYYLQVAKLAYRIKRPVSYFSSSRTCDLAYLKKIYIDLSVNEESACKFQIDSSFPAPGFKIDFDWFDNTSAKKAPASLIGLDSSFGVPSVSITQVGHDFTNVMGEKTVLTTSSILNYYPVSLTETLVVSYSLSFIYNLPPKIFGGANAIKKKFLKQIPSLIERTEITD